uniref:hypothetical protein n=1 Tax=Candidatus Electronema sp. TJ TaxID=3401573 RepID=UPI003AA7BD82
MNRALQRTREQRADVSQRFLHKQLQEHLAKRQEQSASSLRLAGMCALPFLFHRNKRSEVDPAEI